MIESVFRQDKNWQLLPATYCHVTWPGSSLLWNAKVGQGLVYSVSSVAIGQLGPAGTLYSFLNKEPEKEEMWERVRQERFPRLPSRNKALFLFDSRDTARIAICKWYGGESRILLRTRITTSALYHTADATWLDCERRNWESYAYGYWSGRMTDSPIREVIVCGAVYFPDWDQAPIKDAMFTNPLPP